jgi:phosphatidate cytidylyltransferase
MSEFPKRILVAFLMVGPLMVVPLWFGGYVLLGLVMVMTLGLVIEFRRFSGIALKTYQYVALIMLCWFWQMSVFAQYPQQVAIFFSSILILLLTELSFGENAGTLERAGTLVFLFFYCGVLTSAFMLVRAYGLFWGFLPAVTVWIVDTGAYWGGSLTGKRKLAQTISPNKTVEGFLWGFAAGFLVALVATLIFPDKSVLPICLTALIAGTAGQLGDLFESKIKRQFGVKDTSSLFPGHGGVWDRTDSLLWVYPLVWLALMLAESRAVAI